MGIRPSERGITYRAWCFAAGVLTMLLWAAIVEGLL